jgi:hypothetical protein
MCVVSMVHDFFGPIIPDPERLPWTPDPNITPFPPVEPSKTMPHPLTPGPLVPAVLPTPMPLPIPDLVELQRLIDEFRRALEAAKVVDRLTGQLDCVDPDKAQLEDRVNRLERQVEQLLAEQARTRQLPSAEPSKKKKRQKRTKKTA